MMSPTEMSSTGTTSSYTTEPIGRVGSMEPLMMT